MKRLKAIIFVLLFTQYNLAFSMESVPKLPSPSPSRDDASSSSRQETNPKKLIFSRLGELNHPLSELTVGDLFLLAAGTNLRVIGAADRTKRPAPTMPSGDRVRSPEHKIPLLDYLRSLEEVCMKYGDNESIRRNIGSSRFLCPEDLLERLFSNECFRSQASRKLEGFRGSVARFIAPFHGRPEGRLAQILVYDMINTLALQKLGKIDLNPIYRGYKGLRDSSMNALLSDYHRNHAFVLAQEVHGDYLRGFERQSMVLEQSEKVAKGSSSAIFYPDRVEGSSIDVSSLSSIEGCDVVASKVVIGGESVLFLSIHTPSDGSDTSTIMTRVMELFNATKDAGHLILGIDANTKTREQRREFFRQVKENGLNFSYFSSDVDEASFLDVCEKNPTAMGMRSLYQAQLNKAFDGKEAYVDYILWQSKPDAEKKLELREHSRITKDKTKVLCWSNPADHLPRDALFGFEGCEGSFPVVTCNLSGPNSSAFEFSSCCGDSGCDAADDEEDLSAKSGSSDPLLRAASLIKSLNQMTLETWQDHWFKPMSYFIERYAEKVFS